MPGLVPGIHVLGAVNEGVDGRDEPGHDGISGKKRHIHNAARPAVASAKAEKAEHFA
jgi:hypothetical protein